MITCMLTCVSLFDHPGLQPCAKQRRPPALQSSLRGRRHLLVSFRHQHVTRPATSSVPKLRRKIPHPCPNFTRRAEIRHTRRGGDFVILQQSEQSRTFWPCHRKSCATQSCRACCACARRCWRRRIRPLPRICV